MSLYNMINGVNKDYSEILSELNLTTDSFDRFRDVFKEEKCIKVLTRTGGGNREYHQDNIDELRQHPLFITDYDHQDDGTYMFFIFSLPSDKPRTDG